MKPRACSKRISLFIEGYFIHMATNLLNTSKTTTLEIAFKNNFTNRNNFSRSFGLTFTSFSLVNFKKFHLWLSFDQF
jgi:hypothetical protein